MVSGKLIEKSFGVVVVRASSLSLHDLPVFPVGKRLKETPFLRIIVRNEADAATCYVRMRPDEFSAIFSEFIVTLAFKVNSDSARFSSSSPNNLRVYICCPMEISSIRMAAVMIMVRLELALIRCISRLIQVISDVGK